MRLIQRFGWQRDRLDPRDVAFVPGPADAISDLTLSPHMPPVYDQGQAGSCTANAGAGDYEYLTRMEGLPDFMPSRLYLYYNTRLSEGTQGQDSGASIRDTMKSLATAGVCPETIWPYDLAQLVVKPSNAAYLAALKHIELQYQRVDDNTRIDSIRSALTQKLPVVFGCTLWQQFMELGPDGIVNVPNNGTFHKLLEPPIGDHAMCVVGHDDPSRFFIVRNSYGKNWGSTSRPGYCLFPYDYLGNTQLASDFWVGRKVT